MFLKINTGADMMQVKAFHLDLKAGCYREEYLGELFRRLAGLGYTHIVLEIEDKVRLESIAGAEFHEAYSKQEFSKLLAEAFSASLIPIPLIQTLGHLEFLLSHTRYHNLRESPSSAYMLCPSNKKSYSFLQNMISEVDELFREPPFFHLGADEALLLGNCPSCKGKTGSPGKEGLFAEHINRLAAEISARGRRPVIWADMVLTYPSLTKKLHKDIVLVDWDYSTGDDEPDYINVWGKGRFSIQQKNLIEPEFFSGPGKYAVSASGGFRPWPYTEYLLDLGFDVWVAPALSSHGDHFLAPRFIHLPNTAGAVKRLNTAPRPGGIMVTSWALRLPHIESQWPGAAIISAAGNADNFDWRGLEPRISSLVFGGEFQEFFRAWEKISAPLLHTHSYLGIEANTHYYGPIAPLSCLLEKWDKDGTLKQEINSLHRKIAGYKEGEKITSRLIPRAGCGKKTLSFWNFAARAMRVKAEELNLAANHCFGAGDGKAAASDLLMETEARLTSPLGHPVIYR